MTTDEIITAIVLREGAQFTDHAADKGGASKFGITQATLSEWRKRPVTAREVAELDYDEARDIYAARYINLPGFTRIKSDLVRVALVDWGVHSGPMTAIKYAQRLLNLHADGVMGPITEKAINDQLAAKFFLRLNCARIRFLGRIVANDPKMHDAKRAGFRTQAEFVSGWLNRVAAIIEESLL